MAEYNNFKKLLTPENNFIKEQLQLKPIIKHPLTIWNGICQVSQNGKNRPKAPWPRTSNWEGGKRTIKGLIDQEGTTHHPSGVPNTIVITCYMGDFAMPSGAYEEICSSAASIQKRKEVRLFMPMMNRCSSSSSSSSKRRKTTSSSYHAAFNVHEDLIWEILFHLPPKHVVRFKCVSKTWYSIISNPDFLRNHSIRFHHHFFQPTHEFLLLPQDGEKEDLILNLRLDHDFPDQQPLAPSVLPITGVLPVAKDSDFVFIDSCNGLLLYADAHLKKDERGIRCMRRIFTIDDYYDDPYYVCNPVTKNYVKLPNLIALLFEEDENKTAVIGNIDARILFDPSVSLSYKVIRFLCRNVSGGYRDGDHELELYIYSSESGLWRLSTTVPVNLNLSFSRKCVLMKGVIYWGTYATDILCFDAEKNSVWSLPLPPKPGPDFVRRTCYFGGGGGRLCLIEKYSDSPTLLHGGFDIMEMTVEDGRWTKKYHVNLEANHHHHHLIGANIQILHIYKTGGKFKQEEVMLIKIDARIVSFSLKRNTFGKELTIPFSKHPFSYMDVYPSSITMFPL